MEGPADSMGHKNSVSTRLALLAYVSFSVAAGALTVAYVPPLLFTTVDVTGANTTSVTGVNDSGEIVGSYSDDTGLHGFLRDPEGVITTIDSPGASFTVPADINNLGAIVGSAFDASGYHGFLRSASGAFTAIAAPGATLTWAVGINDLGAVVGFYYDDATGYHAYLREPGGNFTNLDKAGATFVVASDVDNAGTIVGHYIDATGLHGFLRDAGGTFTTLDMPGASSTELHGIDNAGAIVGTYRDNESVQHGFVRDVGGVFTVLHVPHSWSTQAQGSNAAGMVVGTYVTDSASHGFSVLTRDVTPPTLTVPEDVYEDGTSPAGATVAYEVSAVDDGDPDPRVECSPQSGGVFQLLVTTVSCTATDAAGNTARATFDVIVKDANWQLEDAVGLPASWNLGTLGMSLTDKLAKAKLFNAQGKFSQACETLASLLNQVSAQAGKGLTTGQAWELTVRVTRIRNVIGC
jgi:hypothetical protein